jgi:flagella basal body P-ring formation protein FlgA
MMGSHFSQLFWPLRAAIGLLWSVLLLNCAYAQQSHAPDYRALVLRWATEAAQAQTSVTQASLRLEVTVGNLDNRLKLAACASVEPYLPTGSRLWGKTRVGLRCVDGPVRWAVSLPVTVKAFGDAWVVKSQLASGAVITQTDVVQAQVDWAEDTNPVLADASAWMGQTATRMLSTGQTLRQGMVKPAQVFQAGAPVRVVAQGAGFQVSGDAQALSAGVVGQLARVRMENGRIATGIVLDVHTVKIDL